MTIPPAQAEAAAFLARLAGAAPIETPISAVFLGPDTAWKMKKAVTLGFLDFATLAAREKFCRRELALNAPHAPTLYRDVIPLTRAPEGGLALGGPGQPVEWLLRMARLPPDATLDARLPLDAAALDALADAIAELHATAPRAPAPAPPAPAAPETPPILARPPAPATSPILARPPVPEAPAPPDPGAAAPAAITAMAKAIAGNRQAARAAGLTLPDWPAEAALARLAPRLAARDTAGFRRRCHGDLHLGNLCLLDGRPTAFDALEFDEDLATIDTGYDLAFLLMDLDLRQSRAAANRVLNRYIARTGDAGFLAALPLFLALRALIRAHVEARRADPDHPSAPATSYLAAARAYLAPARPTPADPPRLIAIGGLQGTGKSHLARRLAPHLGPAPGALILRSDEIRKRLAGTPPETRLPPAAYTAAATAATQAELLALAETALAAGHSVIADATWRDPTHRAALENLAVRTQTPFTGLWLDAPLPVLQARIAARQHDASDATATVLEAAAATSPGPIAWHRLDATQECLPPARALIRLNPPSPPST